MRVCPQGSPYTAVLTACVKFKIQNERRAGMWMCVRQMERCARRSFGILNLTQAVRTDLYAKMEILAGICDIYR